MGEVLDEPFHISYPQVFKHKDRYFMLPETKRSNNILLYEAKNFPYDWGIVDTLIHNVRYKDPSIYLKTLQAQVSKFINQKIILKLVF